MLCCIPLMVLSDFVNVSRCFQILHWTMWCCSFRCVLAHDACHMATYSRALAHFTPELDQLSGYQSCFLPLHVARNTCCYRRLLVKQSEVELARPQSVVPKKP